MDELVFLGTGTSQGIPVIACRCAVCRSSDPRDARTRCSALFRVGDARILIDTTPDLRFQALRAGIDRLDGVVITHEHADHVAGLDDLRPLSLARESPLPVLAAPATAAALRRAFGYVFSDTRRREGLPWLVLREIEPGARTTLAGVAVETVPMEHGGGITLGVRIGDAAWLTDLKRLSDAAAARLAGLRLLALDMLREAEHPTHLNLEESLAVRRRLGDPPTWFIHMSHEVSHAAFSRGLPAGCRLAHDGLALPLPPSQG